MPTTVEQLGEGDFALWDAFVDAHPDATFFHRAGWKAVLERSFGHDAPFLMAKRAGQIVGVLPLVHIRSMLFGKSLSSTAFCVEGGPLTNDPEAALKLDAAALALAGQLGVDYLEYRAPALGRTGWVEKTGVYAGFHRAIGSDHEQNLRDIPRKQRAVVRQSLETGLVSKIEDDVDLNWRLYADSVHRLGTPVFPRRYFATLKEVFGPSCEILNIYHGGEAVAGCLTFYFRQRIMPYYAGGTVAARQYGAHDFMYWDLIRRGAENGYKMFDFGRSKVGTGPYSFKKNWGFKPTPLVYAYHLSGGASLPDNNPLNPKYRLMIEVWKRLPLPIANMIGPLVVRSLG